MRQMAIIYDICRVIDQVRSIAVLCKSVLEDMYYVVSTACNYINVDKYSELNEKHSHPKKNCTTRVT